MSSKLYVDNQEITINNLTEIGSQVVNIEELKLTIDVEPMWEAFIALANTLYIGPFRNAINVGTNSNYYDIPVGQAFISQWRNWKTGPNKKYNEAANAVTENLKAIFEFTQLEINPSPDDTTLQVFINRKSYRLSEFGSGLTQFFLVLANAAMRNPAFILIDEPELNLHPSLQLDFLTTLASYASKGILFATHNIGLARSSANQMYAVRQNTNGQSEVTEYQSTPRLAEFLGELSYEAYKERGSDKILLVEGPSDLRVIQQFLRLYGKEHEIVLLQMGGGQLIKANAKLELEEIQRISHNISAVIDSERTKPDAKLKPDRTAFVAICGSLSIECHVLTRRSLDNYLSDRAVKEYKGNNYQALGPYELLKGPHVWDKANNWRIARIMTEEELAETDLGKFLKSL